MRKEKLHKVLSAVTAIALMITAVPFNGHTEVHADTGTQTATGSALQVTNNGYTLTFVTNAETNESYSVTANEDGLVYMGACPEPNSTPNKTFVGWNRTDVGNTYYGTYNEEFDEWWGMYLDELPTYLDVYNTYGNGEYAEYFHISEDTTYYAVYKYSFTVKFESEYGPSIPDQVIGYNEEYAVEPTELAVGDIYNNHKFEGWSQTIGTDYFDEIDFNGYLTHSYWDYNLGEMVYLDEITLTAKWSEVTPEPTPTPQPAEEYTVTFKTFPSNSAYNFSKLVSTVTVLEGELVSPLVTLPEYGIDFSDKNNITEENITLDNLYKYTFVNYYTNDKTTEFDFTQPITEDTTIYLKYDIIPLVAVKFKYGAYGEDTKVDGSYYYDIQVVEAFSTIKNPGHREKEVEGVVWEFVGWTIQSDLSNKEPSEYLWDFDNDIVEADWNANATTQAFSNIKTLYEVWNMYYLRDIEWDLHDGTATGELPTSIISGNVLSKPADPVKEGATFKNWCLSATTIKPFSDEYDFCLPVTKKLKLHANWEYTVTFDSQGGTPVDSQQIVHNGTVIEPTDPVRAGYNFVSWTYVNSSGSTVNYTFTTRVKNSLTLTAKWEPVVTNDKDYIVLFDTDGGSYIDSQTVSEGELAVKPNDPTKGDSIFEGWYYDPACLTEYDFATPITSDITLYAKWKDYVRVEYISIINDGLCMHFSYGYDAINYKTIKSESKLEGTYISPLDTLPEYGLKPTDIANLNFDNFFNDEDEFIVLRENIYKCDFVDYYADVDCTSEFDFTQPIDKDTAVYMLFKVTPLVLAVTYNPSNELEDVTRDNIISFQLLENGEVITEEAVPVAPEGYEFNSWQVHYSPETMDYSTGNYFIHDYVINWNFNTPVHIVTCDEGVEPNEYFISPVWEKIVTPTPVPTSTPTPIPTSTPTPIPTSTPTPIPTSTPTPVPTSTPTPVPTSTSTPVPTSTPTPIPTSTPTPVPTSTPTPKPVVVITPKPVPTSIPTPKPTNTPTPSPTSTPTPTVTPVPEYQVTVYMNESNVVKSISGQGTYKKGERVTIEFNYTILAEAKGYSVKEWNFVNWYRPIYIKRGLQRIDFIMPGQNVDIELLFNVPTPTVTPTPEPTSTPTPKPTNTPIPTSTPVPTSTPTPIPTSTPTPIPTSTPTPIPTSTPTPIPTSTPTPVPTSTPTPEPTNTPVPTSTPTPVPVIEPTSTPTPTPTPIIIDEKPDPILNTDIDNGDDVKTSMGRFMEGVKTVAVVLSIGLAGAAGIIGILLLLLLLERKVKVYNNQVPDEYAETNWVLVDKVSIQNEDSNSLRSLLNELFKKEEYDTWKLIIKEKVMEQEVTDEYKIVLTKKFVKKHNGETLIIDREGKNAEIALVIYEEEVEYPFQNK